MDIGAAGKRREQGSGGSCCQRLNETETRWRKKPASQRALDMVSGWSDPQRLREITVISLYLADPCSRHLGFEGGWGG